MGRLPGLKARRLRQRQCELLPCNCPALLFIQLCIFAAAINNSSVLQPVVFQLKHPCSPM